MRTVHSRKAFGESQAVWMNDSLAPLGLHLMKTKLRLESVMIDKLDNTPEN
jgi:hypothetical protein